MTAEMDAALLHESPLRMGQMVSEHQQELKFCAIDCLRAPYDPAAAAPARACLSDPAFDWPGFLQLIHGERVSPLIHHHVGGWGLFPPDAAASAHRAYLQVAWVNALRLEELQKILDLLAAAQIPVTLLKGAALLYTLYEKSALRPMSDMDLLVAAEEIERAGQILLSSGYAYVVPPSSPEDFQSEVAFQKEGQNRWIVELHASLFVPPHLLSAAQLDWFLHNREAAVKDGREIWTFNPTAQVLHLAAHLWLHHGGGDLLGWNDLYQVIRQNQARIDWEEVLAVGASFELLLPLQKVLPELAAHWNSPVPEVILSRLRQMSPSPREKRKFGKFWGDDQNYAQTFLGGILSFPDWPGRLRYAWVILFPSPRYIQHRYKVRSPLLIPYFYAYRLAARAVQQIKRTLKRYFPRVPTGSPR